MPRAELLSLKTISRDHCNYHGWSTLTRRRNGQLLVAASGRRESHVCPFGRVDLIRSDDNGVTWSLPEPIYDGPIDDRDAGILETKKGTLIVTWFTSLAFLDVFKRALAERNGQAVWGRWQEWNAERARRWQKAVDSFDEVQMRKTELGEWCVTSSDGGKTWSKKIPTIVSSPHGPIQLKDGRIVHAGCVLWTGPHKVGLAESTDEGRSWKLISEVAPMKGHEVSGYHEPHIVEAADGWLVMQIRNHNNTHRSETLQTESFDGGKTWRPVRSIGVWGLPSHLTRLRDGRLLMSYGYRRPPFGNQVRISENHGKTWSDPITLSDDGIHEDLGYPATTELPDGTLVSVWYQVCGYKEPAALRQARWRLVD